jgi:DNA polymerase III subunit epsilon
MVQGEEGAVNTGPQRGTLLRRAHELLEALGKPCSEEVLIRHLFGAGARPVPTNLKFWRQLLRQTLSGSSLFEESASADVDGETLWSLVSWRVTRRSLDEVDFVVLDTETTGLRPGPDRVIEVAAVRVRHGEIVDSFQSLVNPGRRLPPFIVKFTGISQEMVQDAPRAKEVMPDFLEFIDGAVLVGHNLGFDLNFLTHEAQLLGWAFPLDGLDTIPLARRFLPGLKRFKLDMVAEYLKIPPRTRHRALGDAETTAAVFLCILERARTQGIVTLGHLRRRLQLPVAWSGDITQIESSTLEKQWHADEGWSQGYVPTERPNGGLFLNPAWKRTFPEKPGVYLMRDANKQVIYVGKAKNLKNRLSSYYSQPFGYTKKMDGLLQNVYEIETRVLGSELEALLVESRLIKELRPIYNVQLLNYELYPFIKIDVQSPFPRVYATREVEADGARYFGPFRSRHVVDLTIELVQKIFPIRTCTRSLPPEAKPSDPCLRLHLERCPGPCRGDVDTESYRATIGEVCAFLGGEREDLLERLRRQMFEAAQQLNFERAAWLRDAIRSADEVLIGQRLITGAVEANNLFIVYPSAQEDCDEVFLIRHGRLVQQRCVSHTREAMDLAIQELLVLVGGRPVEEAGAGPALSLQAKPPPLVGKAEVDQINIISRWIHRHSDDRAFFPLQPALTGEEEVHLLCQRIWQDIEHARTLLPPVAEDEDELAVLYEREVF